MQATFLKINPADSVVVCLEPKKKGEIIEVDGRTITVNQDTPAGHKVLIKDVAEGENIIKYGYPIGHAMQAMKAGDWVNENNLKTNLSGTLEYTYSPVNEPLSIDLENRTFKGYVRKNGDVGIRNEIWIVPTVGCVNGIAERLVKQLRSEINGGVDAVYAWHHNYGCSQLSEDHENTRKVLRDICLHPNAGAVLVLSLGCENNQPEDFMAMLGDYDKDRIKLLVTQRVDDEMEAGMEILRQLYDIASKDVRTEVPVSKLRVGLKCGGSDGFSGITANPLVGEFSDWLLYEYRSGIGWDAAIPSGLLVYHIDRSVAMNSEHPLECLVPAADQSNWNHQGLLADYLYPGTKNVTSFNPVDWTGNPTMYQLSNIHKSGDAIVFNTTLSATRVLEGKVVDALGDPLANREVQAWLLADAGNGSHDFTNHDIQVLKTDSKGRFTLTIDSSFDDPTMGPVVGAVIKTGDYSETVYMYSPTQSLEIIIGGQGQEPQTWSSYTDLSSAKVHDMHTQVSFSNPNQIMFAAKIPASQLPSGGGVISSVSFVCSTGKNYVIVDAGAERILTFEVPSNYVTGRYGQLVTIDLKSQHVQFPEGKNLYVGYAADVSAGQQFPAPFTIAGDPGNFYCAPMDLNVTSQWTDFCWWNEIIPVEFSYYPLSGGTPGPDPGSGESLTVLGLNCIADPGNGVYKPGDSFKLEVEVPADASYSLTSVSWTMDGAAVSAGSVTLTAGKHVIVAVANFSDGTKETLELRLKAE